MISIIIFVVDDYQKSLGVPSQQTGHIPTASTTIHIQGFI